MESDKVEGMVFDIQRFSVHDGPGIRTTVFLKGCPLSCIWCHNPESHNPSPQVSYNSLFCVHCGSCVKCCPMGCHGMTQDNLHTYAREHCVGCRKCSEVCVTLALEIIGKLITAGEVMDEILKDKAYYQASRGGVTLSGGEPLSQPDFAASVLSISKASHINTAIETSGSVSWEAFEKVLPYTDLFLFDYKESDTNRLMQYTGADYQHIYENLLRLNDTGIDIVLRCPIIPGINDCDAHFRAIGRIADKLKNVSRIDVEPYNPLGQSKFMRLGKTLPYTNSTIPDKETVTQWVLSISRYTNKNVKSY